MATLEHLVAKFALCLASAGLLFASSAKAQGLSDIAGKKAVGVGIFYGIGTIALNAPPDTASAEVKGYSAVLPATIDGAGMAIGLNFGKWGIVFGSDDNTLEINKLADVLGTPGNTSDDMLVSTARRVNQSLTVMFRPYRWIYFGLGQDENTVSFNVTTPLGAQETHRFTTTSNFYSIGLAVGFDPEKNKVAPILTVYTKVPTERKDFGSSTTSAGFGVYF